MKKVSLFAASLLLLPVLFAALEPAAQTRPARNSAMTCLECHADPAGGGWHGGFRPMVNLTPAEIDNACLSCHDGTYTNAQGVTAPEAAVHENPGGEFGAWRAGCLDCHNHHYNLPANDGSPTTHYNVKLMGAVVPEADSADYFARIRKPIIQWNTGTKAQPRSNDVQLGWECSSGVPDDAGCIETAPPAAGDGVRKLIFYLNTDTDAVNWAQSSAPYTGACNTCHTRTAHHRRDDSGGDHIHKLPQPCKNCHNHSAGWVDKGG